MLKRLQVRIHWEYVAQDPSHTDYTLDIGVAGHRFTGQTLHRSISLYYSAVSAFRHANPTVLSSKLSFSPVKAQACVAGQGPQNVRHSWEKPGVCNRSLSSNQPLPSCAIAENNAGKQQVCSRGPSLKRHFFCAALPEGD